ncbi:MAG TPA: glutathione S-transferase family protein [Burkholderiaceae bacterium]|nr:glutathione S-transferase family protein [Burkholderiaceae bacterium]
MASVNLYGLERSVYTRIARLALEEKGVGYTLHETEIFGAGGVSPEHRARQPFGRIPAFEHDGFWLYETGAITRYVDEAWPGPALQPRDGRERARMNQIVSLLDSYAYRPMVWSVFVERVGQPLRGRVPDEVKIADGLAASERCLGALAALAVCQPHLLGAELTLADLHAYPMLRYLSLAREGEALLGRYDALHRWRDRMAARPGVQRTRSRYELSSPPVA